MAAHSAGLPSRPVRLLIAAALLTSLVLGAAFIAVHRSSELRGAALDAPGQPVTDDQTRQQVLDSARQFVGAGKLRAARGSYHLVACTNSDQPPYHGTAYVNFDLPTITETPEFFREIARVMMSRGWSEGLPPNRHPGGRTMAKDGMTAYYYRHPDIPRRGVLQLSGECRKTTDHRADSSGFLDISGQLYG